MSQIKIKCLCGEQLNENLFKAHFKLCETFKANFNDLDTLISQFLKKYDPLLVRFLLKRYIKLIEHKYNIFKKGNKINNINKIFNSKSTINKNKNINNIIFNNNINRSISNISIQRNLNSINNSRKKLKTDSPNYIIKKNNKKNKFTNIFKEKYPNFSNFYGYNLIDIGLNIEYDEYETIVLCSEETYTCFLTKKCVKISEDLSKKLEPKLGNLFILIYNKSKENKFNYDLSLKEKERNLRFSFQEKVFLFELWK